VRLADVRKSSQRRIPMPLSVNYPVFDADNHMYETTDAFTKYLPAEYAGLVKYVEVNGRTKIALRNVISNYIPNPTFNKVAPPGAQELEFRIKNPSSKHSVGTTMGLDTKSKSEPRLPGMPPRYIESPPAFFNPEERIMLMDELGVDRAMMWPTLASLLEERLADDPVATAVVVHALNEWMHEHWTFDFENRIFATPVINLSILDEAIRELDYVVERGARAILIRPAPVPDFGGRRRSLALPEFDPFWKLVQESGVLVGMHSSDDGAQRYINEWDGSLSEFSAFTSKSMFSQLVDSENGSQWVPTALKQFQKLYERSPRGFDEDPMKTFHRSIIIHPFFEEDVLNIVDLVGTDNVVFGSDYPHPEGLSEPLSFLEEIEPLAEVDKAKIMGGTLSKLMQCDPTEKVVAA
jgi:predicted TIM-barrel fold metal-dependent hydrolase